MTIGDVLKNYIEEHNYSFREFSRLSGVSCQTVINYVNGTNPRTGQAIVPTLPNLKKISETIGIPLHELCKTIDNFELALSDDENLIPSSVPMNRKTKKLLEKVADFSPREFDDIIAYADFIISRR